MATLALKGVTKAFGPTKVIHGIDLEIAHGEFIVFVGPSGCGKSTLLRMIAGLEDVTTGDVAIDGAVVNAVPAAMRGLAMVFQSYALYPHMSVKQNLSFGLENLGTPKAEIATRVDEAREDAPDRAAACAQARPAFRRAAPARRDWPRCRARAQNLPFRRAALEP